MHILNAYRNIVINNFSVVMNAIIKRVDSDIILYLDKQDDDHDALHVLKYTVLNAVNCTV